jgi:hypothetical protein
MNKIAIIFSLILALTSGCQLSSSVLDDTATMVAETVTAQPPTSTPPPTSTALPTKTLTPLPTATPEIELTSTAIASEVLSEIKVAVGEDIPYADGYLGWQQKDPVEIFMSGAQQDRGIFKTIDNKLNVTDFIFKSDVTWEASGIIICGAVYRSEENLKFGRQYQLYFYRLSGLPAYFIDVYEFGKFKNSITGPKFASNLDNKNKATNQMVLVAQGEQFTVYLNGKRQGRFYDDSKQRLEGIFGFLGWQDSGQGSCKFENSWIWVLPN